MKLRSQQHAAWLVLQLLASVSASPPIRVSLRTPERWPEPPLLVQILESVSFEKPAAFFPLLEQLAALRGTDQHVYSEALTLIRQSDWLSQPGQLETLQLSLAAKEASARVQAAYEWHQALPTKPECDTWVAWGSEQSCHLDVSSAFTESNLEVLPFDHLSASINSVNVVLYADPTAQDFLPLLKQVQQAASQHSSTYALRWKPSAAHLARPLALSSYGAALNIKKSDYLAIDDRNAAEDQPAALKLTSADRRTLAEMWQHPDEGIHSLKPLSRLELLGLGEKATDFILSSSDPLNSLVKLSQDFPKYATPLAATPFNTSSDLFAELQRNRQVYQSGFNAVWLNGMSLSDKQIDVFALLKLFRSERQRVSDLASLGLTTVQAVDLLSHPAMSEAMASARPAAPMQMSKDPTRLGMLFDASDREEGGKAILWWNDIERDKKYARWPSSLQTLLQPTYPGNMPQVRRNIFHMVLALDMAQTTSHMVLAEMALPLVKRMMPFRVGFVPLISQSELSYQMARLMGNVFATFSKADAMALCSNLARGEGQVGLDRARKIFEQMAAKRAAEKSDGPILTFDQAISQGDLSPHQAYAERLALDAEDGHGQHILFDGSYAQLDASWQKHIQTTLNSHLRYLQTQVMAGAVDDETDLSVLFYDLPSTYKMRSALVFPTSDNPLRFEPMLNPMCESGWLQPKIESVPVHSTLLVDDPEGSLAATVRTFLLNHADARACFKQSSVTTEQECTLHFNGRVIGPVQCSHISIADLETLHFYESSMRLKPAVKSLETVLDQPAVNLSSDLVSGVVSVLASSLVQETGPSIQAPSAPERLDITSTVESEHSSFIAGETQQPWLKLVATLDPLSEEAQKTSALLQSMYLLPGVQLRVILNPAATFKELSVKRFYRDTFASQLAFDDEGALVSPALTFKGMPETVLLNLEMDIHPAWLAFSRHARQDLDNIRLVDLSAADRQAGITSVFELEKLLVEGHCRDMPAGIAPRGLQLELLDPSGRLEADSLVMANLGYVQLQASHPGLFKLQMRSGRSRDIFTLDKLGQDVVQANQTSRVAVMALDGVVLYPQFSRNKGMESTDVLEHEPMKPSSSILSKLSSIFSSTQTVAAASSTKQAEINVFTVASGHLYERMAMIMMVSVMRHTDSTVKFWFISNFLSPAFKSFIPHLAEHYGFQYELVTYKWPNWLRGQSEKQRTIWGYKILFLDVLFPLGLDRIIFVDSDQIVRTDLKQLVDLDLQGRPYAYTPMGDDREEMEGFRFWKTGYWRDALRGRPYHISALYAVDLARFRQLAAGDRLRQQYQALSADPNSLANLDQDLPNNMQSVLPIYTLDRSWLWCETWCSDESLAEAKTIDLCNNPLTHEPKLARARRLIPEWSVYDAEIAQVAKQISQNSQDGAGSAFEADVSSLEQAKLQEEEKQEHSSEAETSDDAKKDHQTRIKDEL